MMSKYNLKITFSVFALVAMFNLSLLENSNSKGVVGLIPFFNVASAETETGIVKEHSEVVFCGSKAFHDMEAGCCEGTGGCVDNCNEEYDCN